jgi:hypothetical protein
MARTRCVGFWSGITAVALAGCTPAGLDNGRSDEQVVEESSSALTGQNGIWQNGLTTNGIWQNGIWQNGIWQNGIWQNGIWQNGIWQNGIWQNGIWQNGIWQNGIWQNGSWENGIWQNGIWQNGIWQNGVWEGNLEAREMLRTNPYAGKLLQYIYSCAMPAGATKVLDPEGANVVLEGAIGLAPTWDSDGGSCDESCQRWVSACVLARTNAYGVKVDISMRAPDTAPDHIKAALAVTDDEKEQYSLREGAFYGNLFATTPPPQGTDGPIINTPSFYACAGPGSNIPDITKRFCSSQGDQAVIKVPGVCQATSLSLGACSAMDADATHGALQSCYTHTDPAKPRTRYDEVITVYLKDPIEVCGNAVCEAAEASSGSCPSDCLPDGWARSFAGTISEYRNNFVPKPDTDHTLLGPYWLMTSVVSPDDTIVLAGSSKVAIDLGGGALGLGPNGDLFGVLAKYGRDGQYLWGKRFGAQTVVTGGVAVGPDGSIAVVATEQQQVPGLGSTRTSITRFDAQGQELWSVKSSSPTTANAFADIAVDAAGNTVVAALYRQGISFGALSVTSGVDLERMFVLKLSPDGVPVWLVSYEDGAGVTAGDSRTSPTTLATDPEGNVLLGVFSDDSPLGLSKLSASNGEILWSNPGQHWGVTTDAAGNVYATGSLSDPGGGNFVCEGTICTIGPLAPDTYDFPLPPTAGRGDFFVAKYAGADGATIATHIDSPPCRSLVIDAPCQGRFDGHAIRIDETGNVVVGIRGGNRNVMDFGAGSFPTYDTWDVFVNSYSPSLDFLWAKHVPMVLEGAMRGLDIDSRGRIVMSGTYAGSMLFDNRLLVSYIPELRKTGNTFLASFRPPSPADVEPPVQDHVPEPIVLEATSSSGSAGWFMPPTSIDTGYSGTSVTCDPPSSSTFPIGTTTVTCTATDPLGNVSEPSTFDVTVRDTISPMLSGVPPLGLTAEASSASGAIVNYALPVAIDQVDGARTVSCSPSPGSLFPFGTTTVECLTSDAAGNQSATSFEILVVDTTPPVLTLPGTIVAVASSPSGAVVTYPASAFDTVDGPITPICTLVSGSQFAFGISSVTCTASDIEGNTATGSFDVQVAYPWSGVLQPIDADGSSIFKLGSTVSVKFQLTGVAAGITNAVATLSLTKVSASITGSDTEVVSNSQATAGNTFRYDSLSNQYLFNLATKGLSVGTWQLSIDLGDGVSRTVLISLKK